MIIYAVMEKTKLCIFADVEKRDCLLFQNFILGISLQNIYLRQSVSFVLLVLPITFLNERIEDSIESLIKIELEKIISK